MLKYDLLASLKKHEGFEPALYHDTRGIPTIGYGFNLTRNDAKELIEFVGGDYDAVMAGTPLKDYQCERLLEVVLDEAIAGTKCLVTDFEYLPEPAQLVLCEMCFQLGPSGLGKFKKMLKAVEERDFDKAAVEMLDSMWSVQVPNRAWELARLMRGAGKV